MAYTLVVVESPNKVKKIEGFLGPQYRCVATVGHFRDLPTKGGLGITREGGRVIPDYTVTERGQSALARIRKMAKGADHVILATDPDREGEAIAWHVVECLPKKTRCSRATFGAITKAAVTSAIKAPRHIDQDLVDAQQARRLLDRCVGWFVSPTLSQGLHDPRAKSAGRVQSAALRIVVDHERDLRAFRETTYFALSGRFTPGTGSAFVATLDTWQGEGVGTTIATREQADAILAVCRTAYWRVLSVDRIPKPIGAPAPYITSTIQKDASRLLKLRPADTMAALQRLFEEGHITYHRTDSPSLAPEAVSGARAFIQSHFPGLLPEQAPQHRAGGAAQEAHEAIRPTHWETGPEAVSGVDATLYRLIWARFLASQMKPGSDINSTLCIGVLPPDSTHPAGTFVAKGTVVAAAGFRSFLDAVLPAKAKPGARAASDAGADGDGAETAAQLIPAVAVHDPLTCLELTARQTATKPKKRLTQASLITVLEKSQIGRPSTYATILTTILDRGYVDEDALGRLSASDLGMKVIDFLIQFFADDFLSLTYTKNIEAELDAIAKGALPWMPFFTRVTDNLLARARQAGYSLEPFGPPARSAS